jgi:hypothetical protein
MVKKFTTPSGPTVIAGVALFVSLGGGAYAAASGSVGHDQLASNSVWHNNIGNGSVKINNLANGSVGHKRLETNSVWHDNIGNGSVQKNNLSADILDELSKQGPPGPTGPPGPPGGPAASEYGVANVLVSRGGAAPTVWATYSGPLGSPVPTSISGVTRFSCTQAQGPCKVSIAAAVLSNSTGTAHVHATVLINREASTGQPNMFCEYANDTDNSGTPATVSLVPMTTPAASITQPLSMGIGGTLDCNAGQPYSPSVTNIWVPGGPSTGNKTSYYNVETTFDFGG